MKLWKVTVNNWGWDQAQTLYAKSREEAQQIHDEYPAADDVQYAGNFREEKARELIER